MAKNRLINTKIWADPYFTDLPLEGKLLFIYFLSNSHTDISGIYEVSSKYVVIESGLSESLVKKWRKKFQKDRKMLFEGNWVAITNFIKHQVMNPSVKLAIEASIQRAPPQLVDSLSQSATFCDSLSYLRESNIKKRESKEFASNEARGGHEGMKSLAEIISNKKIS